MNASVSIARLNSALAGRYDVERELGEGGMATVYLARDDRHDRPVALKVLKPELAAAVGPERFLAEIKTTATLQHPHILPLFDSGQADGLLYYVMPYVEGESVRERIGQEGPLPVDDALRIVTQCGDALHHAHEQGNVLLSAGHAVVADFGVARALEASAHKQALTRTGVSIGTVGCMGPEQASGERGVDARSDVYALGCLLYEMLSGEEPFMGSSPLSWSGSTMNARSGLATSVPRSVSTGMRANRSLARWSARSPMSSPRTRGALRGRARASSFRCSWFSGSISASKWRASSTQPSGTSIGHFPPSSRRIDNARAIATCSASGSTRCTTSCVTILDSGR